MRLSFAVLFVWIKLTLSKHAKCGEDSKASEDISRETEMFEGKKCSTNDSMEVERVIQAAVRKWIAQLVYKYDEEGSSDRIGD